MTEEEWLTCTDPSRLLRRGKFRPSGRKSRLFAVACCRLLTTHLPDERSHKAVEVAEHFADGMSSDAELAAAARAANEARREMFRAIGKVGSCIEWAAAYSAHPNPFHAAKAVSWMAATQRVYERRSEPGELDADRFAFCTVRRRTGPLSMVLGRWKVEISDEAIPTGAERPVQSDLIRCIFGNPFRPVTADPRWLTSTTRSLAQAIYEDRVFDRLPILADALEEAGCDDADVLNHLRGEGPHVKGCWAVDLVLGKEQGQRI